jgi:hypothetical protein
VASNIEFTSVNTGSTIDNRVTNISTWDNFDDIDVFTDVTANVYISTTDDDPSGSPTWSDFKKLVVGDYTCRAYKFELRCASGDITHQINVEEIVITIDAPDRMQGASGLSTSSTATTTVSFADSFQATPAIGVTVLDMATGDYVVIASESLTGFDIDVRNSGGSRVERTFNYIARGY